MSDRTSAEDFVLELLQGMNRGQYLLLTEAIRAAGGIVRIDVSELQRRAAEPSPRMTIDGTDGPVLLQVND